MDSFDYTPTSPATSTSSGAPPRYTLDFAVSFEFPLRPVLTHKGTVRARSVHQCVRSAFKSAQATLHPRGWTSVVVVLEKRAFDAAEVERRR